MGISPGSRDLLHHLTRALADVGTVFQRMRCWSPQGVIMAVMLLTRPDQRTTYASLLTGLAEDALALLRLPAKSAKSALSVARRKVPVETFRTVLHRLVAEVSAVIPGTLRHFEGRRFIAIDATSLVCPRSESTLRDLDRPHATPWMLAHYPRALVVVAFDLVRRLPIEWVLLPKGRGERAAAEPLLGSLRRGDVAIVDRGYPARWLLDLYVSHGIDLVMRMTAGKGGAWPEVQRFLASKAKTAVVPIAVNKGKTVTMRLLRRDPPRGRPLKHQRRETVVILTTLLPRHGFEARDIHDLYARRWGVESLFREMKEAFAIERFHARTLDGIQQEIATVLMWMALTATVQGAVQDGLPPDRRANRMACREAARVSLLAAIEGRTANLEGMIVEARRHSYTVRPGRSFPRESKVPFGRHRNRAVK